MVRTQQIANLLNGKLNTIATAKGVNKQFKLKAHLGKTDGGNIINGILKPTTGTPYEKGGTGSGTNGAVATYVASLVFPTSVDNSFATIVEDIVATLIEQEHGGSFTINGGKAVWEMTYGVPEGFDIRDVVGSSMPISFTVKVSFGSTGLLNGIKAWTLDGQPIPYVQEAVILNRYGKTISIDEARDQQTIPTAQAKQFKFTIPYDSSNVVCTTLKNDILMGAFTKTYQLTYDDGAVQFSKTVTLYANGDTGTNGTGENTILTVSFVEAGGNEFVDADGNTIRYQIALVNWDFSDTSENTLYFASQSAQQTFMVDLATDNASSNWMSFNAPNLNNVLETTVEVQRNLAVNPDKVMNYNYAIIRKQVFDDEDVLSSTEYSYYFVSQATAGAFGMVSLALKMDTIQTYLFNSNIEFADCMIERACLNRWVDNGDGTVSFDGTPTSKLFEREPIQNLPKVIVSRTKTTLSISDFSANVETNSTIYNYFEQQCKGWLYVYFDQKVIDLGLVSTGSQLSTRNVPSMFSEQYNGINVYQPFIVFAFPIMPKGKIKIQGTGTGTEGTLFDWDAETFLDIVFQKGSTGNDTTAPTFASYILSMRISQTPPLEKWRTSPNLSWSIGGTAPDLYLLLRDNMAITSGLEQVLATIDTGSTSSRRYAGGLYLIKHNMGNDLFMPPYTDINSKNVSLLDLTYRFTKAQIIGANKNYKYNPKLLGQDFTEINVGQFTSPPFTYDAQKLNTNNPLLRWRESLVPGITRAYIGLTVGQDSNLDFYGKKAFESFVGSTISQDTTIPGSSSALSDFLTQNKNFYQQQSLGNTTSLVTGTIGNAAMGAALGSALPGIGTLVGAAVGLAAGVAQQGFSLDNIKNAPNNLKNIDGNAVLPLAINDGLTYVEIKQALPSELKIANDFMFMNGFTYNQLDNPLNHLHTRKYFDYIKADITDILGLPLSNIIRADIQQRFSNGLRFWNVDTYQQYGLQYDKENYELGLEA